MNMIEFRLPSYNLTTNNDLQTAKSLIILFNKQEFRAADNILAVYTDCGLNAIRSASGSKNISRRDIFKLIEAHHYINSVAANHASYDGKLIISAYSAIHCGNYVDFRTSVIKNLTKLIDVNQSNLRTVIAPLNNRLNPLVKKDEKNIANSIPNCVSVTNELGELIRKIRSGLSFEHLSDEDYKKIIVFCRAFCIKTESVFKYHKIDNIKAYENILINTESCLSISEILVGMMANGYLCISQQEDTQTQTALFKFENQNTKQVVYLYHSVSIPGVHWIHVIPEKSLFTNQDTSSPRLIKDNDGIEDNDGVEDNKRLRYEVAMRDEVLPRKKINNNINHPVEVSVTNLNNTIIIPSKKIDSLKSYLKLKLANIGFSTNIDLKSIFTEVVLNNCIDKLYKACQNGSLVILIKSYMSTLEFSVDDIHALFKNVVPNNIEDFIHIFAKPDNINKLYKIKKELNLKPLELVKLLGLLKDFELVDKKIKDLFDEVSKLIVLKEHYKINDFISMFSDIDRTLVNTISELFNQYITAKS